MFKVLEDLITNGKTSLAIELALMMFQGRGSHASSIIQLSGRWNRLQSQINVGIAEGASVESNRINCALESIVNEAKGYDSVVRQIAEDTNNGKYDDWAMNNGISIPGRTKVTQVVVNKTVENSITVNNIIISTPYDKELSEYVPKTEDSSIRLIEDVFKLKLQYFVLAAEFDTVFPDLAKEAMEVYDELKVMAGSVIISTDLNELDDIKESLPEFQNSIIGFKERAAKEIRKANNSENSRVLTLLKADLPTFKNFQEAYAVLKEMKRADRVEMPSSLPKNDVLIRVLKKKFINAVK